MDNKHLEANIDFQDFPLFRAVQSRSQEAILQKLIPRQVAGGQILLVEGEPAEYCYFIRSGLLRAIRMNPDGRTQVLSRLTRPEPVNVISLLSQPRKNHATIEALSDASLFALSAPDFDDLAAQFPDFSAGLLQLLAHRVTTLTDKVASLSLFPARTRLARFIIQLANGEQPVGGSWTQDEIAAEIGTTRDIVGRLLREFEQQGLIERRRSEIVLLDRVEIYKAAELPIP